MIRQAAWDKARAAVTGTEPMTLQANPEELAAYQYLLARAKRDLEKQHEILNRRRELADISSKHRQELSNQSHTRGSKTVSKMAGIPEHARGEHLVQNLSGSFLTLEGPWHPKHRKLLIWRRTVLNDEKTSTQRS